MLDADCRGRSGNGTEGSVSLEMIAALPVILLALLIGAQLAISGYGAWSAGIAARAGARAVLTGGPPDPAVRHSLPPGLGSGLEVARRDGVTVSFGLPRLLPGLSPIRVSASSDLGS